VQGSDGNFYGLTTAGGVGFVSLSPEDGKHCFIQSPSGYGTIFRMTPDGTLTTLVLFDGTNGNSPSSILQANDGNFYGTMRGNTIGLGNLPTRWGTVFKMTPDGTLSTLSLFNSTNGSAPGSLIQGRDGNFYGTTDLGGAYGFGTVFKISSDGVLTTLVSFNDTNASGPYSLMQASNGNFYGTMFRGGKRTVYFGTVFRLSPDGTLTNLVLFNRSNGAGPLGALVEGTDGNFYVATWQGGLGGTSLGLPAGAGMVLKMTPQGKVTTLFEFNGLNGLEPAASLVQASDGSFYGTTSSGGTNLNDSAEGIGTGEIFRLTVPGADSPKIIGTAQSGGRFSTTWLALTRRSYQLQFNTNLTQTNWSNTGGLITATNSTASASDTIGADSQRFYRVVLSP